ncbi:MAG TPA: hypothetical protein VGW77_17715 [Candidatus Binatia bacterium]|jgi:hypothetical protein|nr:hypothetical protein [Candidatus Binatia bacterium]
MGLEDTHLDVLQNIEFAIVSVYREHDDLVDYNVMRALDALIDVYRSESRGHTAKAVHLPEVESLVAQRVQEICEFRLGRNELTGEIHGTRGEITTAEEIVSCLRKIRKSVDRWNRQGGKQGYLQFIEEYVK